MFSSPVFNLILSLLQIYLGLAIFGIVPGISGTRSASPVLSLYGGVGILMLLLGITGTFRALQFLRRRR